MVIRQMSNAKRGKNSSSRRESPLERALRRYDDLRDHFATHLSNFVGMVDDPDDPCTGISFSRRDDGGFLVIMKRDNDMNKEIMFCYGEDFWLALLKANSQLAVKEWSVDKPRSDG